VRQVPLVIEPDTDDPDFATVMVDATIAGRPYRLVLDTGAAHTQLDADEYTSGLSPVGEDSSFAAFGGRVTDPVVTITDLEVGPLRVARLDVTHSERAAGNLLGMDVLRQYCCHFRLDVGVMGLGRLARRA
jgi:predicted aspartyl protease